MGGKSIGERRIFEDGVQGGGSWMRKSDHANNLHITHSLEQATSVIGRNIEYTHQKNTVLTIKIIIIKL